MSKRAQELAEQVKAKLLEIKGISGKAEEEDRDFTDDERAQVTAKMTEAQDLKGQLDLAKADDQLRASIHDLGDGIGLNEKQDRKDPAGHVEVGRGKSLGKAFTASAEYNELLKQAPNGNFQPKQRIQSMPVGYKALVTGGSDTSAGAFVQNDYRGLVTGLELFERPFSLRNLVTPGQTTSDTVEYARITGITNNAAPVAEATSSASPTVSGSNLVPNVNGGYKPESGLATTRITTPVKTIAHWIPVTKRALSDAAQVETLIDQFLAYGLEEELEDQMIAGDGTGENFEGLAHVSGTQSQAAVDDPTGKPEGFGKLLAVRRAKTKVRTVGRAVANGVVIHPNDLQDLDEISDNQGRFYFGGPSGANGTSPLWGLSVVESEAATEGTAWVGDWRKAILWDREQSSITITDSHADFFIRNLVAILAEMRAAFGVIQPSAFVKVDLSDATS